MRRKATRDPRGHKEKKTQDPMKRSQGSGGEKTWDPRQRQRKSPPRQNPGTEEDSYSRRPGEPKEEVSVPDSHATFLEECG
ncbi:hypothetical protein NDU88_000985 [Pleurodeles waltl]|uniref:Uncharacterized protein n=1 Tax=Pleurodeles waltl TaxID=8319 RepID=A0AAV7WL63_PLEWA|nr:hypothetical protein NDU88_000985 [Pleurodeles waltl]